MGVTGIISQQAWGRALKKRMPTLTAIGTQDKINGGMAARLSVALTRATSPITGKTNGPRKISNTHGARSGFPQPGERMNMYAYEKANSPVPQ